MNHWSEASLFSDLSAHHQKLLEARLQPVHYQSGDWIMKEGENGDFLLIIGEGEAYIEKEGIGLATIGQGKTVGLVAMLDNGKRTADVLAGKGGLSGYILTREDYLHLKNEDVPDLTEKILHHILEMQNQALINSNTSTVQETKAKLETEKKRVLSARFFAQMVLGLVLFTFLLGFLHSTNYWDPSSPLFNVLLIGSYGAWGIYFVNRSGIPKKSFGLTMSNFKSAMKLVISATTGFILLMILTKWLLTIIWPEHFGSRVIGFYEEHEGYTPLALIIIYSLHSIVQEFIARGCIQGGLQEFNSQSGAKWGPIILATLMFASIHVVQNFAFAVITIIPGLFWGYLFYRHRNVLALSFSHIAIGLFALFFLNLVPN